MTEGVIDSHKRVPLPLDTNPTSYYSAPVDDLQEQKMPSIEILNTDELAEMLNVVPRTIIRWRVARTGPPWVKAGRRVLYRRKDVDAWMEKNLVNPVGEA